MNVSVDEQHRGKCLKLHFAVLYKSGSIENVITQDFNIDDTAEARFKFSGAFRSNGIEMSLSLKKHVSAKDRIVKLDVKSGRYTQQWTCINQWIDWQIIDKEIWHSTSLNNHYLSKISISMTVIEDNSFTFDRIYEDSDWTDFILSTVVGSVAVHRACLAAHSDVFKTMLSSKWKETADGRVEMEGVTLQTLQHLKQYMYLGTLPDGDDGLRPLLLIAMCYMIDHLKAACISKLAQTVTSDNLLSLLDFASENKIPELTFAMLQLTPDNVVHQAYKMNKEKQISKPVDNVVKE